MTKKLLGLYGAGPGDGAAVSEETILRVGAESESEFLLFDLV